MPLHGMDILHPFGSYCIFLSLWREEEEWTATSRSCLG